MVRCGDFLRIGMIMVPLRYMMDVRLSASLWVNGVRCEAEICIVYTTLSTGHGSFTRTTRVVRCRSNC